MTLSILEQFNRVCKDGEGDIICPECGVEIGQWYDAAWRYLEKGKCPICDCNGDTDDIGKHEWCEHCTDWCEGRKELEEQRECERYIDNE